MCSFANIVNSGDPDLFNEDEINKFLKDIYLGVITISTLDLISYFKVANKLTSGVYEGFGVNIKDVLHLSEDYKMLYDLRDNVFVFSAAKQYQQVRQISSFLTDNGKIVPFNEFKKKVMPIYTDYNVNYLNAEYGNAIATARSVSDWKTIQKDIKDYPQLQYETIGDGRVRPEHAALDGIIRPVNDSFWDTHFPPNGWGPCRCSVIQTVGGIETPNGNIPVMTDKQVPEIFRFNPAKERIVFSKKHPYFDVPKKDKDLAKNNFNLPRKS